MGGVGGGGGGGGGGVIEGNIVRVKSQYSIFYNDIESYIFVSSVLPFVSVTFALKGYCQENLVLRQLKHDFWVLYQISKECRKIYFFPFFF